MIRSAYRRVFFSLKRERASPTSFFLSATKRQKNTSRLGAFLFFFSFRCSVRRLNGPPPPLLFTPSPWCRGENGGIDAPRFFFFLHFPPEVSPIADPDLVSSPPFFPFFFSFLAFLLEEEIRFFFPSLLPPFPKYSRCRRSQNRERRNMNIGSSSLSPSSPD